MRYRATVIVVVYNHEDTVKVCLESIFSNSNREECEIIVHDDCSTDDSRKIIEDTLAAWGGNYKLIYPKENRISKGEVFIPEVLTQAEGEVIFMIEGDDYWTFDCNRTSVMSEHLLLDDNLSMVFTDTKKIDLETNQVSWLLPKVLKGRISALDLSKVNYSFLLVGACCFRNKPINFPTEFVASKCRDIWMPLLWSMHGDAEYIHHGGALIYNYTGLGVRSSLSDEEHALNKLVLGFQLLSHFIKTGKFSAAQNNLWRLSGAAQLLADKVTSDA